MLGRIVLIHPFVSSFPHLNLIEPPKLLAMDVESPPADDLASNQEANKGMQSERCSCWAIPHSLLLLILSSVEYVGTLQAS